MATRQPPYIYSDFSDKESSSSLDSDSNSNSESSDDRFTPRRPVSVVYTITITLLALSIICSTVALALKATNLSITNSTIEVQINTTTSSSEHPCGTDANTARLLGCEFDALTFAWLPPRCYDYNLTAEFLAIQDWQWWRVRDDGSLRELSFVNVMQGRDEILYIPWEYHRQHCAYMWVKMHRAMLEGRPVDGVTMLDIITDVCDGVFRDRRELDDRSVPGYVRYPSCR